MYIPETPLYKFFSEKSDYFEDAMKNLAEGRIWLSGIETLNDPWEGVAPLQDHILRLIEIAAKEAGYSDVEISNIKNAPEEALRMIRKKGIYCCSSVVEDKDPRQNKLLWSHYGNGGRGVCIEFRPLSIFRTSPNSKIGIFHSGNIQYRDETKNIGKAALDFLFSDEDDVEKHREFVELALFQKPQCWGYEAEYRLISDAVGYVSLDSCPVSAIYFGPRAGEMVKCLLKDVFPNTDEVKFFNTSIDRHELKITG